MERKSNEGFSSCLGDFVVAIFVKNRHEKEATMWRCAVCGYVYDEAREGKKFEDLPDDYKCPVCNAPKEAFVKM
jgi:rubredoxin